MLFNPPPREKIYLVYYVTFGGATYPGQVMFGSGTALTSPASTTPLITITDTGIDQAILSVTNYTRVAFKNNAAVDVQLVITVPAPLLITIQQGTTFTLPIGVTEHIVYGILGLPQEHDGVIMVEGAQIPPTTGSAAPAPAPEYSLTTTSTPTPQTSIQNPSILLDMAEFVFSKGSYKSNSTKFYPYTVELKENGNLLFAVFSNSQNNTKITKVVLNNKGWLETINLANETQERLNSVDEAVRLYTTSVPAPKQGEAALIKIINGQFYPSKLVISEGTQLIFTNADVTQHTIAQGTSPATSPTTVQSNKFRRFGTSDPVEVFTLENGNNLRIAMLPADSQIGSSTLSNSIPGTITITSSGVVAPASIKAEDVLTFRNVASESFRVTFEEQAKKHSLSFTIDPGKDHRLTPPHAGIYTYNIKSQVKSQDRTERTGSITAT